MSDQIWEIRPVDGYRLQNEFAVRSEGIFESVDEAIRNLPEPALDTDEADEPPDVIIIRIYNSRGKVKEERRLY